MDDFRYHDSLSGSSTYHSRRKVIRMIRVLEVLPGLTKEGLISCELTQTILSNTHTALSYTWGMEEPQYTIIINGKLLKVRQNLYQFLNVAQNRHHSKPLWIDAICINQGSIRERNEQVAFMTDIYSQAEHVLVWLGQDDLKLERIFRYSQLSARDGLLDEPSYTKLPNSKASSMSDGARKNHLNSISQGIQALCCLQYWERAWVVQEFQLSRSKTILYGDQHVSAEDLSDCFSWFTQLETTYPQQLNTTFSASPARALCDDSVGGGVKLRMPRSLAECLKQFQNAKCADFHDHVFAFRSLFEDGDYFPVNYAWSKVRLLLEVSIFSLEQLFTRRTQHLDSDLGDSGKAENFLDARKIKQHRHLIAALKRSWGDFDAQSSGSFPNDKRDGLDEPAHQDWLLDAASASFFYIKPSSQGRHARLDATSCRRTSVVRTSTDVNHQIEDYVLKYWYPGFHQDAARKTGFIDIYLSATRIYLLDSIRTVLISSRSDPSRIIQIFRFETHSSRTGNGYVSAYYEAAIGGFRGVEISNASHFGLGQDRTPIDLHFEDSRWGTLASIILFGLPLDTDVREACYSHIFEDHREAPRISISHRLEGDESFEDVDNANDHNNDDNDDEEGNNDNKNNDNDKEKEEEEEDGDEDEEDDDSSDDEDDIDGDDSDDDDGALVT